MRYWVHHESECVWITDDEISESDIDIVVDEIDEDIYLYLLEKGYTN